MLLCGTMRPAMDWSTVLTTFGLVFVAELGDKTQLAVLAQTCKYRRPWAVFWGASLALTAVTALGAVGGQVVGRFVPASTVQAAAALGFVVMGALVAREAAQTGTDEVVCEYSAPESNVWKPFASTFGLLFVAEMGDKTQLAVLSLAGRQAASFSVFVGGTLALVTVTALGAAGGEGLSRLIPRRTLLWLAAAAFLVMGALIGCGVL